MSVIEEGQKIRENDMLTPYFDSKSDFMTWHT